MLAIRNARAVVRTRRLSEARERERRAAATALQRTFRGHKARAHITLFRAGDRVVGADGAKILDRGESPSICTAIRRGVAVDLGALSKDATEAFLTFLETGCLYVGEKLAAELVVAAQRHQVSALSARCAEILRHHADPASAIERWFRATAGSALLTRSDRDLLARLGPLLDAGFQQRFVPTRLGRIHALDKPGTGEEPPIIVIHGLSVSSLHLAPFLGALARSRSRIVAIDLPGHGLSEVPAIRPLTGADVMQASQEAARAIVEEPAWVYGNSFGGMSAVRFALDAPDRVLGLVLASPAGTPLRLESRERLLDRFRVANHAQALAIAAGMGHTGLKQVLAAFAIEARFRTPHLRELVESADNTACFRPRDLRDRLPMPVLLIFGEKDALLDDEHRSFFLRHLPPHAVREEPEDLAHVPQIEAPDRIAARVLSFIAQHRGSAVPVVDHHDQARQIAAP